MPNFSGFSPQFLTFFRQLARNNDRNWFNAHKEIFETQVRQPMIELVGRIGDDLRKFAVDYVPEKPEKAIYRIYRDTRFSKDKTPYKTHIAAHFQHGRLAKNMAAGFYFSVSHAEIEIAGGMYMPGPEQLLAMRKVLQTRGKEFAKLTTEKALVKSTSQLLGERLARVPKGFDPTDPAGEWLRMKQYYFGVRLDARLALKPGLQKQIVDRFKLMTPVVQFINDALLAELGEEEIPQRPAPMF